MSGLIRGLLAAPLFLLYAVVALWVGDVDGSTGIVLLVIGALGAGYLVGSPWALLIAVPFALYGVFNIDDPGPLENTDSGWGILILAALAAPVAVSAGLGALLRTRRGR